MSESLFLRAIRNEPVERPAVWLMRQAGRYLAEYRALKERHGFLGLCKNPELTAEVTLQPLRAFDVDAAILFADILLPAECLEIQVEFTPGPRVVNPIDSPSRIASLRYRDLSRVQYVFDAVALLSRIMMREHPGKALIGFAGAPWTLSCYLIDQGPFKHFAGTQVFAEEHPTAFSDLLSILSELVGDYLLAQVESGAQVVQLFDTWAGNLDPVDYRTFALPFVQRIFDRIGTRVPRILYVNGSTHLLEAMAESGAECLSVDWRTPLREVRQRVGEMIVLQGNLDPTHLFGPPEAVVHRTRQMVDELHGGRGYIANLGHGVLQRTPRENVACFVNEVKRGWKR